MQVAIEHELGKGRQMFDVHERNLGYGLPSMALYSGELRLIEMKGLGRRADHLADAE